MYIAHRGGDADWPEGTAYAYAEAAAWNPHLALEVPVRQTSDGVLVVSEDATTGRVFGASYVISKVPWATLARLHTREGGYPMARLVNDVLDVYGRSRILFVDDKTASNVGAFLDVLDSYAGPTRYVIKSFWSATNATVTARKRGYVTWGYYYATDMSHFAASESKFDLLGLNYTAPEAAFDTMRHTGKPVIAHIIPTASAAQTALNDGARGLMVSDIEQVVPRKAG
jgi:glycerophosphoryl diester phosphodiesterase